MLYDGECGDAILTLPCARIIEIRFNGFFSPAFAYAKTGPRACQKNFYVFLNPTMLSRKSKLFFTLIPTGYSAVLYALTGPVDTYFATHAAGRLLN